MQYVNFKYPAGIIAKDKVTGISGTITVRAENINGMLQYAIQPRARSGSTIAPDALWIDEANIVTSMSVSKLRSLMKGNKVGFHFAIGDKVRSRVNGYEGIVTGRKADMNNCERYQVEGKLDKTELHGLREHSLSFFAQELEYVDAGLNKKVSTAPAVEERVKKTPAPQRTGGPSRHETLIKKATF